VAVRLFTRRVGARVAIRFGFAWLDELDVDGRRIGSTPIYATRWVSVLPRGRWYRVRDRFMEAACAGAPHRCPGPAAGRE
jgi:hypothetical protein